MYTSNFFYKRKLSVYNLTATLIVPGCKKITYCAIWNETLNGRSGNDIASVLLKILSKVVTDHPNLKTMTLWSDSCVPQNRNSINSTAILKFLHDHSGVEEIVQKYCEPGHSCLQEVDAVHSVIEKHLRNIEVPSQVSLIRILKNMNYPNVQLQLLQMNLADFKNFTLKSNNLSFKNIKFFK